jgi:copper chaperone CopZ
MNRIALTILSTLALLVAGCGDRDARAKEKKADPAFMFWCYRKEIASDQYHVPEMATAAAATYLQNALGLVAGYESSSADLESRTLTVSYYSTIARKMNFEEAIALAGFSVNGRPANPVGVQRVPEGVK